MEVSRREAGKRPRCPVMNLFDLAVFRQLTSLVGLQSGTQKVLILHSSSMHCLLYRAKQINADVPQNMRRCQLTPILSRKTNRLTMYVHPDSYVGAGRVAPEACLHTSLPV